MKRIELNKEKVKAIAIGTFLFGIVFSGNVFAIELDANMSEEYNNWIELTEEEKEKTLMPQNLSTDVPDSILSEYELNSSKYSPLFQEVMGISDNRLQKVKGAITDSKYVLSDYLNLRVENQENTAECWAISCLTALETNIGLTTGNKELKDFSERHMDYYTSRTFKDGENLNGYNREVGKGGLPIEALSYLTNGSGAVLEEDMPFENNTTKINLSELNKDVDTIVTKYVTLPRITKKYTKTAEGNTDTVRYFKSSGEEYTAEELIAVRNMIKEHLVKYGAVTSMNAASYPSFYDNSSNIFKATNYNCNDSTKVRDHGITIVGWDDTYSKDNFAEGAKPSTDGAYIVLNSYGESNFNNGYLYISYEDYFIESEMYGIVASGEVDYDNIYQHDYFGGVYQVGTKSVAVGYYGATYERNTNKVETLENVGVTLVDYAKIEIFVNPTGTDMKLENLIKIGESTEVLSPGYHRIAVDKTELKSGEFAIVIKQTGENGTFYFDVESRAEGTDYALVDTSNRSFLSFDGENWNNLNSMTASGVDMTKADVCIKAFTKVGDTVVEEEKPPVGDNTDEENKNEEQKPEDGNDNQQQEPEQPVASTLSSNVYKIENNYVMQIAYNTKKEDFLKNVTSNGEIKLYDENDELVENNSEIIKTGMKLKLADNTEYTLIVRGDINKDGTVNLVDLSKMILHYNEKTGFILTDNQLKAADMNCDGKVNLVDVSQLVMLYSAI